jgi:two-component sensor histidine kinase
VIWAGTDNGINILDKNLATATYLNTSNSGICDNTIYSMLWQNDQAIWLGTQRGLSKYDISTRIFANYFIEDGICNNEFNRNSTLKGHDGRLYMGGLSGVTAFFPWAIQESTAPAKLFTSSITIWDQKINKERNIPRVNDNDVEIRLKTGNMPITFDLGISDYSDPSKNTYYYRIKGLNSHEGWIAQGPLHVLKLTNLPTGSFTLEIKAANSRGIVTSNILRYQLTVIPPFYQTWWFYSLVVLLAITAVYLVILLRLKNAKLIEQQRVKIASDLHDEIGGLVTRITVYSSSLKENYLSREEQSQRLEKIIDISQSLSTSIRDVLWAIDARNDRTSNLADYMLEHSQNQIRFTDIKLIFETAVDRDIKMSVFTRQQLYRIFKEAINNILKHSKATYIKINYEHQLRKFSLEIENDGVVTEGAKKSHIGQGSRNMVMRAKSIGAVGEINVTDKTYTVLIHASKKLKRHK